MTASPLRDTDDDGSRAGTPGRARALHAVPDDRRRIGWYERHLKRPFDVVGGVTLLVVLSPVLAVTAVLVRFTMGRPVLFRQARIGRHGVEFEVLKFRSMRTDRRQRQGDYDGRDRRLTHKTDDDPRHTGAGRFIRRASLDELPQLLNVIRGEMSLVGPRPELTHIAEAHDLVDHPRHLVRPGMTGLWQVSPDREGFLYENTDKDLEYLDDITLRGDLRILWRTVGALGNGS